MRPHALFRHMVGWALGLCRQLMDRPATWCCTSAAGVPCSVSDPSPAKSQRGTGPEECTGGGLFPAGGAAGPADAWPGEAPAEAG
eukprot:449362-Heterocapsa_arctica.AAC.1